jgi:hypothetical protein
MTNDKEKPMKLMAFAALLVMFLIGVIVGGLGVNAYNKRHMVVAGPAGPGGGPKRPRGPGGPNGQAGRDKLIERLRTELKLTDDQTKQVRDIMSKTSEQFDQIDRATSD